MIFIGADHRGFELKEYIKDKLNSSGYLCTDLGDTIYNLEDDYTDYAYKTAKSVIKKAEYRGILICGSGVGMDIAANKVNGIRSALITKPDQARSAREHDDVNVLALPADFMNQDEAWNIIQIFLVTPFSGEERHLKRLQKIKEIEKSYGK